MSYVDYSFVRCIFMSCLKYDSISWIIVPFNKDTWNSCVLRSSSRTFVLLFLSVDFDLIVRKISLDIRMYVQSMERFSFVERWPTETIVIIRHRLNTTITFIHDTIINGGHVTVSFDLSINGKHISRMSFERLIRSCTSRNNSLTTYVYVGFLWTTDEIHWQDMNITMCSSIFDWSSMFVKFWFFVFYVHDWNQMNRRTRTVGTYFRKKIIYENMSFDKQQDANIFNNEMSKQKNFLTYDLLIVENMVWSRKVE
jgi:hypothetical protein